MQGWQGFGIIEQWHKTKPNQGTNATGQTGR